MRAFLISVSYVKAKNGFFPFFFVLCGAISAWVEERRIRRDRADYSSRIGKHINSYYLCWNYKWNVVQ